MSESPTPTPRKYARPITNDRDTTPRDPDPPRLARGTDFELGTYRAPDEAEPEAVDYDHFGPYRVFECLGAGGMAAVHRATVEVARGATLDVALKRLLPQLADDKKFVGDFIREAKLAAQLHHPNIVKILELGRIGRTYYIAMELVRGHSMSAVLKKVQAFHQVAPIGVTISLMTELCDVLDYVANFTDEYGEPSPIVHRDLSPSNLLIGDDGHLNVIDFGVAKAISGKFMTNTGLVKGKLGYLAPEAIAGKPLDARADIFSAGVVMWELLAGRRLFSGRDELAVLERIKTGPILPPSSRNDSCPTELDDIVMQALARDPDARWATGMAMRRALEELRRHYRGCSPRDVGRWKDELKVKSWRDAGHIPDTTETPLSSRDLEELLDENELTKGTADITVTERTDEVPEETTSPEIDVRIYFHHNDVKP